MKGFVAQLLLFVLVATANAEVYTTKPCPILDKRNGHAVARLDSGTAVDTVRTIKGLTQVKVLSTGMIGYIPLSALMSAETTILSGPDTTTEGTARQDSIWIMPSRYDEWGLTFGNPNPYSRTWRAYMGSDQIAEQKLFSLAGKYDTARKAGSYNSSRSQQIAVGILSDIGGLCLMAFPGSKPDGDGALIGGSVVSAIGLYLWFTAVLQPDRYAPYQVARQAADEYNASR